MLHPCPRPPDVGALQRLHPDTRADHRVRRRRPRIGVGRRVVTVDGVLEMDYVSGMPAAARVGDPHVCPVHGGGAIAGPGVSTILIGGMPAVRTGDLCVCAGPPMPIVTGEPSVLINGLPAARMTDLTAHGGTVLLGFASVQIGVPPQAVALREAAMNGAPFCDPCPSK
jgi:uncharacterized Zn-binding protein involved in type VI secretion